MINAKPYNSMMVVAVAAAMGVAMVSCLENDIPYERVPAGFTAMTAEGETAAATIDNNNRTVTLTMGEAADLAQVNIVDYTLTEGAELSTDITGGIDLTGNYKVTVSLYQDYEWVLRATQQVERYFNVVGQVGSSVIDPEGRRVVVTMPASVDLSAAEVTDVKLGPIGISTMTPDLSNTTVDLSQPVEITVSYRDVTEVWTVYALGGAAVSLDRVDVWTGVIWAYGSGLEDTDCGFEYRLAGSGDEWTRIEGADVTHSGGEFSACISPVSPVTAYELRAFSGDAVTEPMTVTTGVELSLPNMGFDEWWMEDDKLWQPWAEGGTSFWDTGNDGAATFASFGIGGNVTSPDTDTWNGLAGYSAKLETDYIVVKLAGGNIFAGEYVRTDGTNGVLNFGRPFTGRPTRLLGHWKYNCTEISHSSEDALRHLIGQPDTAIVYAALINKPEPVEIRTNPANRQLFDRNADYVIAYGEVQTGETIPSWTDFVLTFDYRRTDIVPTHLVIVATASKYADYFTGGDGSTLWLDDFTLDWDYE